MLELKEVGTIHSVNVGRLAIRMTTLIQENMKDPELRDWILPSFSTTTQTDQVVAAQPERLHRILNDLKDLEREVLETSDQKYQIMKAMSPPRLGVAISKRRVLLKSHEQDQRTALCGTHDEDEPAYLTSNITVEQRFHLADAQSNSDQTATSYEGFLARGPRWLRVLDAPQGALYGQPFECPLCHFAIQIMGKKAWMRPIFGDLMLYV